MTAHKKQNRISSLQKFLSFVKISFRRVLKELNRTDGSADAYVTWSLECLAGGVSAFSRTGAQLERNTPVGREILSFFT